MPDDDQLSRLAEQLHACLEREAATRQEWIEQQYTKCLTLVAMRDQFPGDREFGRWCLANDFGEERLSHQDRAAAITMGRHPEDLRTCLEATERRSLRLIHGEEFCFTITGNAPNPASEPAAPTIPNPSSQGQPDLTPRTGPRRRRPSPGAPGTSPTRPTQEPPRELIDEVLRAWDQGQETTHRGLSARFGCTEHQARRAIDLAQGERRGRQEPRPLEPAEMAHTTRQRYEATVRVSERRIREEVREEIRAEISANYDQMLANIRPRLARADRIIANQSGLMTRQDYRKLIACLHPDVNTFSQAREVFEMIISLEDLLVKPDPPAFTSPLPATIAEMMAARRRS